MNSRSTIKRFSDRLRRFASRNLKSAAGEVQKIASRVYKVTPQEDLAEGEYGFYNAAGTGPSGGAKIFDFGIKVPR